MLEPRYTTFREFWPYYLSQHASRWTRRLHLFGSLSALAIITFSLYQHRYGYLALAVVVGYFPAWVGHFFIEKNKPATFRYPLYSLMGDVKMIWQSLTHLDL